MVGMVTWVTEAGSVPATATPTAANCSSQLVTLVTRPRTELRRFRI
jgi:hypothetical protein